MTVQMYFEASALDMEKKVCVRAKIRSKYYTFTLQDAFLALFATCYVFSFLLPLLQTLIQSLLLVGQDVF